MTPISIIAASILLAPQPSSPDLHAAPTPILTRVPENGIQPQAATAEDGTLHLVYFKGEARAGDLFYITRAPGAPSFSAPIRVNSEPGSACAAGTIRGAQLALGRAGRVHIAWNGSGKDAASTAHAHGQHPECPMFYTRLDPATGRFDPQRSLMTCTRALDGGGTIAADKSGTVIVGWHGLRTGGPDKGESNRQVWLARSTDDGSTFAAETPIDDGRGACACCGMAALADRAGGVHLLYRAAKDDTERGMVLLSSLPGASTFTPLQLDDWRVQTCPMSSSALAQTGERLALTWENKGQVFIATLNAAGNVGAPQAAPGDSHTRKHPRLAANSRGELLVVWADGTGWQKGGSLAWQLFDAGGRPVPGTAGKADGVPVWSFAAPVTRPDGTFEVLY